MCESLDPKHCTSFINCTGSFFISNWTEQCCQPQSVRNTRSWMLFIIGTIGTIGTICNTITISTFLYLYFFPDRIKRKFGQDFSMTRDPVFLLILHLSCCDLLYCLVGLPTYWDVYYHGYYPYSHIMCQYFAFFRNAIAYADFHTLALISAYFALRRNKGASKSGGRNVIVLILLVWVYSLSLCSFVHSGICGQIGFNPVHGKCMVIPCPSCFDTNSVASLGGIILVISVGIPAIVVLVSYSLVYLSLSESPSNPDTSDLRRSTLILAICYFVFILPISIIEWIPADSSNIEDVGISVYSCHWFIYIINFVIYILFWRRVRMGIHIFLKDMLGIPTTKNIPTEHSTLWWQEMHWPEN